MKRIRPKPCLNGLHQGLQHPHVGVALGSYAGSFSYPSHGAISSSKLGNNLLEHTAFNNTPPTTTGFGRLQPTAIGLGTSSTNSSALSLGYDYGTTNNNGNVRNQTIAAPGLSFSQIYSYDALNRLNGAEALIG